LCQTPNQIAMNPFLLDILTSSWLLHSENPDVYGAMIASMLKGENFGSEDFSAARRKNHSRIILSVADPESTLPLNSDKVPSGSIAVIPIKGVIMKEDAECGPRGSVSLARDIRNADANPAIKSILLYIDSPGGASSFTDILSQTVKDCTKPVIAFVEGMAASAAYWVASAATKIICSSDLDRVGSIGTMLEFVDMKPYFEKNGVVIHEVYATLSSEKNQTLHDLRSGNYDKVRADVLDKLNEKFHANVQANRPSVDASVFSGKIFYATDAINAGLVDEIGSFEYALEVAASITVTNSHVSLNNQSDMKIKMLATWAAIATFFGFTENIEKNELTEEMIGQLNDKLSDQSAENANLKTSLANANENNEKLSGQLSTLQTTHDNIVSEFEAFKKEDAGRETRTGKKADKTEQEIISDNYLHNRIADAQL